MPPAVAERKSLAKIRDDVDYFKHQVDGVNDLFKRGSFILGDEMGTGKSLQALTVAAVDVEREHARRIIIVCPLSLKGNWADEVEKFTHFTCVVLNGTPAKRKQQLDEFDADILIVNYEQVRSHLEKLVAMRFDDAIYDEAHMIKGWQSQRSKACKLLSYSVQWRNMILTGSPMLNHVDDLWMLLHVVRPDEYPNYWTFVSRYCNAPEAPIWMADGTFKPIGKVQAGDKVLGWERIGNRRSFRVATVEEVRWRVAPDIVRVALESGNVIRCTPDHQWLAASKGDSTWQPGDDNWVQVCGEPGIGRGGAGGRRAAKALSRVVNVPRALNAEEQRAADWIAGMYDGEGSNNRITQYVEANPGTHAAIGRALDVLGIDYRVDDFGYDMRGGRQTFTNLLAWCDATLVKRAYFLRRIINGNRRIKSAEGQMNRWADRIVSVEHEGPGDVVSMQTSTGNYIAWGYASKNCVFGKVAGFKRLMGTKNVHELNSRLQQVMLRRRKQDVLDLPDKHYTTISVDLSPLQQKLYDQANDALMLELPENPDPMELENALTKMLRLKQICGTTAAIEGYKDESTKLDVAVERISELIENGERVVVFTQFRSVLECLTRRLGERKAGRIDTYQLHGDIKAAERQNIVKKWAAAKPAAMCCMLQVAAVGLNMTAARYVIFLDKLWSPKMNAQAEDRCHRIGSDKTQPVEIISIACRGTVEGRIETILRTKTKTFDSVVEEDDWKRRLVESLREEELAA